MCFWYTYPFTLMLMTRPTANRKSSQRKDVPGFYKHSTKVHSSAVEWQISGALKWVTGLKWAFNWKCLSFQFTCSVSDQALFTDILCNEDKAIQLVASLQHATVIRVSILWALEKGNKKWEKMSALNAHWNIKS